MSDLAKKLQLKSGGLRILNAPEGLRLDLPAAGGDDPAAAVLAFVRVQAELDSFAEPALAAAREDRIAWIAYPKAGRLGTDLDRDKLWKALEGRGVRPVRQIAVDDVWSALRFRPA